MACFDDMRMRMVDGNIETECLQQHILVEHQILSLLSVVFFQWIGRLHAQTYVYHFDDVLEFTWLFLDLV